MFATDSLRSMGPTRRALLAAGTAILSLSLLLSIAPAFAKGVPSTGTVKLHDVTSGVTVDDTANDPHVCTFTVVFQLTAPTQAGTWLIQVWPATNPATVMAQGVYDTSANGFFETDPMTFPAGHYRLEWQASSSNASKSKTFWVDTCAVDPTASTPASSDPTPTPTPTDTATPTPTPTPSDPPAVIVDPTPTPTDTATPTPTPTPSDPPAVIVDPTPTPTDTATPAGDVEEATGTPPASSGNPEGQVAQAGAQPPVLPNTSTPPEAPATLLTAIGLLMIVAAHPFIRRSAHADRA
jgi:hypothetical protein